MSGAQFARDRYGDIAEPTASNRVSWLKCTIGAGVLFGLLLSHELWVNSRSYPVTPVHPLLRPVRFPFDYAMFAVFLTVLAFIAVAKTPAKLIATFVFLAFVW